MASGFAGFDGLSLRQAAARLDFVAVQYMVNLCPSLAHLNEVGAKTGKSALHQACSGSGSDAEQLKIIHYLMRCGINPNLRDLEGNTALHCFLKNKKEPNLEILMMLIAMGARVDIKNNLQKLPLDLSARGGLANIALRYAAQERRELRLYFCVQNKLTWPLRILLAQATPEEINANIGGKNLFGVALEGQNLEALYLLGISGHHVDASFVRLLAGLPLEMREPCQVILNFMKLNKRYGYQLSQKLQKVYEQIQIVFPSRLLIDSSGVFALLNRKILEGVKCLMRTVAEPKESAEADVRQYYSLASVCRATEIMKVAREHDIQVQVCDYVSRIAAALIALDPLLAQIFAVDVVKFNILGTRMGHALNMLTIYDDVGLGDERGLQIFFDSYNLGAPFTVASSKGSVVAVETLESSVYTAFFKDCSEGRLFSRAFTDQLTQFKAIFQEVLAERAKGGAAAGVISSEVELGGAAATFLTVAVSPKKVSGSELVDSCSAR